MAAPARTRHRTTVLVAAILTLLATMLLPAGAAGPYAPTVLNGEAASVEDFPAVVYIEAGDAACTGSVVHSRWVLTAAHCFEGGVAPSAVSVGIGYDDLSETADLTAGQFIESAEVVLHPDWSDAHQTGTDVALVRLVTPVATSTMPLAAAGAADPAGAVGTVAGWGATTVDAEGNDTGGGEQLLSATVPVLADSTCVAEWGTDYDDDDLYVCAGGGQSDVCQGDSGGPLMVEQDGELVQVGVVAWGESCEVATGTIGAYTSVAFVRSWIDATVGVSPDPAPEEDQDAGSGDTGFDDVPADHPHAAGIRAVSDAGITGGCGANDYCPTKPVTRAQMATFLTKALDLTATGDPDFDDVPADHLHAAGIAAVAEEAITGGCSANDYCPTRPVTRAQMATFLTKALDLTATGDPDFDDVPADHFHAPGIAAVAEEGITGGCSANDYCPTRPVTRAQMATFLMKALDL